MAKTGSRNLRTSRARKVGFLVLSSILLIVNLLWLEISVTKFGYSVLLALSLVGVYLVRRKIKHSNNVTPEPKPRRLEILVNQFGGVILLAALFFFVVVRPDYLELVGDLVWPILGVAFYLFGMSIYCFFSTGASSES